MNIVFTKKIVATIITAIMILGIVSPVFAAVNVPKDNLMLVENMEKDIVTELEEALKEEIGIEKLCVFEKISENLIGSRVYDEDGKEINVLKKNVEIKVLGFMLAGEEIWIYIELKDATKGYVNLNEEKVNVDDEELSVCPPAIEEKEDEKIPEQDEIDLPKESEEEIDEFFSKNYMFDIKNMFKSTIGKVLENSELFENIKLNDEEEEMLEEVRTDFKSLMVKFSKITMSVGKRVLADFSKTLLDKISIKIKDQIIQPDEGEEKEPEIVEEIDEDEEKEPEIVEEIDEDKEKEPEIVEEIDEDKEKEPEIVEEIDEDKEKEPEMVEEIDKDEDKEPAKTTIIETIKETVKGKLTNVIVKGPVLTKITEKITEYTQPVKDKVETIVEKITNPKETVLGKIKNATNKISIPKLFK